MKTKLMSMAALTLLAAINANSQIQKSTWLLGGNISYNKTLNKMPLQQNQPTVHSESAGMISLMAGIAFRENQVGGITLAYSPAKIIEETLSENNAIFQNERKGHQKSIGVFHRFYQPLGNKFYFLAHTSASYLDGKVGITKSNGFDLYLSPGVSYQVLKNIHVEVTIPNILGVYHYKSKTGDLLSSESTAAGFNLNPRPLENLGVGFKIFIP